MTTETLQKAKELEEKIEECNDFLDKASREIDDFSSYNWSLTWDKTNGSERRYKIPAHIKETIIKQIIHTVEYESTMLLKELKEL